MKRSIALAALATLASGAALAQSTVSVYGRLNVSVERQKQVSVAVDSEAGVSSSEANVWALQNSASRIGFKGEEDLGGGLKAAFLIESGFSPDNGTASSTFWGRESWVGLIGNFGKVRLGNVGFGTAAYFATADYISMHNHDTGTSADAFYLYQSAPLKNVIAYATPNLGGFTGELQLGLKETTTTGSKNSVNVGAYYDNGPLHLGLGYIHSNDSIIANFADALGLTAPPSTANQFGIRALYEIGPVTVGAYYINDKIKFDGGGDVKRNAYRLSAMYAVGANEFHVNVGKAGKLKVSGLGDVDGSDATQATIAYNYNLSKRTKLYAFYTKLSGDGADFYAVGSQAGGAFSDAGTASGVKSSFALGVRHNF